MIRDKGALGRAPSGQALAVPVEPVARLDPSGFDPSRDGAASADMNNRSIAARLNPNFKIASTSTASTTILQLSGPLETQDELDALVQTLGFMREWLSQ
jgi:hypothetical protein